MENMEANNIGDNYIRKFSGNIFRIIVTSILLISLAVVATGTISYETAQKALIQESKSLDMIYIVKSMSEKIKGRIQRAMETSLVLARDPDSIHWLSGSEKDPQLGASVKKRLADISVSYDYNSTFMASARTLNYYFEENKNNTHSSSFVTLSAGKTTDKWFFSTIKSKKPISLNVDYDRALNDTFLFVNTLVGDVNAPLGITGVAMSLDDIAGEFEKYKVGIQSKLLMFDEKGIIQLSESQGDRGKSFSGIVSAEVASEINNIITNKNEEIQVSEYKNKKGEIIDYAVLKLAPTDWILYYELPRTESITAINSLKVSTVVNIILVLLFSVSLLFLISRKIANPYKQALFLNKELEGKVEERTRELKETNKKVMDSIDYAKRMQESILPTENELHKAFRDYFVIWKPRDIVGGDFYWVREIDDTVILAVGDCTGHGVPGALMTMTVNALLYHIVTNVNREDPEIILKELDRLLKKSLNKDSKTIASDDGLDLAVCCIRNKSRLRYAGAKINLYLKKKNEIVTYQAYKKGIGYKNSAFNMGFTQTEMMIEEGDMFILTSDGYLHQNGGQKDYPLGTKRFYEIIKSSNAGSMNAVKDEFEFAFREYMGKEPQRDDVVLLGFVVK